MKKTHKTSAKVDKKQFIQQKQGNPKFVVKPGSTAQLEVPANNQDNSIGRGLFQIEEVKADAQNQWKNINMASNNSDDKQTDSKPVSYEFDDSLGEVEPSMKIPQDFNKQEQQQLTTFEEIPSESTTNFHSKKQQPWLNSKRDSFASLVQETNKPKEIITGHIELQQVQQKLSPGSEDLMETNPNFDQSSPLRSSIEGQRPGSTKNFTLASRPWLPQANFGNRMMTKEITNLSVTNMLQETMSVNSQMQILPDEHVTVKGLFGEMAEFMNEVGASKQLTGNDCPENAPESFRKCYEVEKINQDANDNELKLKLMQKEVSYIPREMIFFIAQRNNCSRITFLDISNCSIVELEGRIFMELKNLVRLNAQKNEIKYVSGKIGDCRRLETIQLDRNQLESIPMELSSLSTSLKVLKLAQNKLKSVNFGIQKLQLLEVLHLQQNNLQQLPNGFNNLKNLKELLLASNQFQIFNVPVHNMPKLKTISVDWFMYLSPPLAPQIVRQQQTIIQYKPIDEGLSPPQSPQKNVYDQEQETQENKDFSTVKHRQRATPPIQMSPSNSPSRRHFGNAGILPQSKIAQSSTVRDKSISPMKQAKETVPSTITELATFLGGSGQITGIHRVPREFVKNDSRKPRKPDYFQKLAQLCSNLSTDSDNLAVEFMQFADHFNTQNEQSQNTTNNQDERKRTMLHYAASKGCAQVVQNLIDHGADAQLIDKYGYNPYGLSMREEKFDTAFYLLKNTSFQLEQLGSGAGTFGSLLHIAVAKLQVQHVQFMLQECSCDANFIEQKSQFNACSLQDSPLHLLINVYNRDLETAAKILKILVKFGGNIEGKNLEGFTPLQCAVKRGNYQAVQDILTLFDKKETDFLDELNGQHLDINTLGGPDNQSSLHLAAQNSYYDIVELLIQHGADTFIRNSKQQTPLSSINNNLLMIKLLKKCENGFFKKQFEGITENDQRIDEFKLENVLTNQSKLDFLFPPHENSEDSRRPKSLLKNNQHKFVSVAETQRAIRKHLKRQEEEKITKFVSPSPQQFLTMLENGNRASIGIKPKIVPEDVFEFTVPFQELEKKQIPNLNIMNKQRAVMQQSLDNSFDSRQLAEGIQVSQKKVQMAEKSDIQQKQSLENTIEYESYDSKAEGTASNDLHDSTIHKKMSEALGKSEKRDNATRLMQQSKFELKQRPDLEYLPQKSFEESALINLDSKDQKEPITQDLAKYLCLKKAESQLSPKSEQKQLQMMPETPSYTQTIEFGDQSEKTNMLNNQSDRSSVFAVRLSVKNSLESQNIRAKYSRNSQTPVLLPTSQTDKSTQKVMFSSPARKPNLKHRAKKPSIAMSSVQERRSMIGLGNFSASKNIFAPEIITQSNTSGIMSNSRRNSSVFALGPQVNTKVKKTEEGEVEEGYQNSPRIHQPRSCTISRRSSTQRKGSPNVTAKTPTRQRMPSTYYHQQIIPTRAIERHSELNCKIIKVNQSFEEIKRSEIKKTKKKHKTIVNAEQLNILQQQEQTVMNQMEKNRQNLQTEYYQKAEKKKGKLKVKTSKRSDHPTFKAKSTKSPSVQQSDALKLQSIHSLKQLNDMIKKQRETLLHSQSSSSVQGPTSINTSTSQETKKVSKTKKKIKYAKERERFQVKATIIQTEEGQHQAHSSRKILTSDKTIVTEKAATRKELLSFVDQEKMPVFFKFQSNENNE